MPVLFFYLLSRTNVTSLTRQMHGCLMGGLLVFQLFFKPPECGSLWLVLVCICVYERVCVFHKLERLTLLLVLKLSYAYDLSGISAKVSVSKMLYKRTCSADTLWSGNCMRCTLPTQTRYPNSTTRVCICRAVRVFCKYTLSRPKVLVRAKPQPCSKALRIMAALVVGGALASPNGLGNLIPHISTLMSTASMAQWNRGSLGAVLIVLPWRDCWENTNIRTFACYVERYIKCRF